jgi:hypothetical protein
VEEGEGVGKVLLITVGRYTALTKNVSRAKLGTSANHLRSVFPWILLAFSLAMASKNTLSREQVASAQVSGDYAIKSEDKQPALDTSQWPLLLKNYEKLLVRSSHFTPIPSGCSPLKRDIETYVK